MIEEVEALTEDVEEEEVVVVEEKREEEEEMMEEVELEDVEEEATEEVEEEDMIEEVELEDVDEEMIKEVVTEEVKEELEEMIEEEEEGTSCYKRVHRDNDVKCHFDIGQFVGPDAISFLSPTLPATAATSLDDTKNILVALESGVPVMKILQAGGAGEWVEHRYAEDCWGWTFLDVCAFEERLYAVTTHGRIAEVEFAGDGGEEEEETALGVEKMAHHIFDVVTDTDSHVLEVAADARGNIRKVTVYW